MKARLYFISILVLASFVGFAQDVILLNPNQSLVNYNPSFAGSNGGIRYQGAYQNIGGFNGQYYNTAWNSVDAYLKPLKAGLGLSLLQDHSPHGTLKTLGGSFTYAQHLSFFDKKLKIIPSLQFSYVQQDLAIERLTFGDMVNARAGIVWDNFGVAPLSQKNYLTMSTGVLVNYKNLYAGISVFNFNQPDMGMISLTLLPTRFSTNVSYNCHVTKKTLINFSGRYSNQKNNNLEQVNVTAVFNHITAGLGLVVNHFNGPKNPLYYNQYIDYIFGGTPYVFDNTALVNVGYRNNFMSVSLNYSASFDKGVTYMNSGLGASVSYNLRNKEQRKQLTNLEAW